MESPTITEARKLWQEMGTYAAVGRYLNINPAHIWKAIHKGKSPHRLTMALVKKGLIERPPAKDPRQRAWMRTDDLELAIETLKKHYPQVTEVLFDE